MEPTAKRRAKALDAIREMLCYAIFELEQGKIYPEKMSMKHVEKLLDACREDFERALRFPSAWEEDDEE